MARVTVSLEEQETTINFFHSQVQDHAEVYTCMPGMMRKLRKFAETCPAEVRIEREDGIGLFAQVPTRWIQIRKPKQMHMSEEQREAAAERLREARAKKEGGGADEQEAALVPDGDCCPGRTGICHY